MDSKNADFNKLGATVTGYFHCVSPVKTSKKNNRYFNAILQTDRHDYQNTVVFTPDKHEQLKLAERNKTPIKIHNARKKLSTQLHFSLPNSLI